MRALTLSLVALLSAVVGCDLLTPPPVLGGGERPGGDEGEGEEGEGEEGEGEEGEGEEGEGEEGEGEEGEGEVPGDCEAAFAGTPVSGDAAGGQLDAPLDVSVVGATVSLQLFGAHAPGTYALSGATNGNYATCNECVIAFDEAGTQAWFQATGSLTLDDDPSSGHYAGSVSDAVLEEVTIDSATFESTPVPGGSCFDLAGWSFDFTATAP